VARRRQRTGPVELPADFVESLHDLVPADEHAPLVASFDRPRQRGLRVNQRKADAADVERLLGTALTPVPWCADAYVLPEGHHGIGAHPAHLAGLIYLQEPSAALAVAAARIEPGDWVVDCAAAPGGKTLQLADAVGSGGLVLANEVVRSRLQPLHDNLDLWGCDRVLTTSTSVDGIAAHPVWANSWAGRGGADVMLLDAPCSGEALFRRSNGARREWSPRRVAGCATRQAEIATAAARLVRPGGRLVYATCTFNLQENEQQVQGILDSGDWRLLPVTMPGISPGLAGLPGCARVWPHRAAGEGQFVAVLERVGGEAVAPAATAAVSGSGGGRRRGQSAGTGPAATDVLEAFRTWAGGALQPHMQAALSAPGVVRGTKLFLPPAGMDYDGAAAAARPGVLAGELRPGRFEPGAGLATFLTADDAQDALRLPVDDGRLGDYLAGAEIADPGPDASVLVCLEKWGLGWARRRGGVLKNAMPGWVRAMAAKGSGSSQS
jgi:16S rRNA C967 or C1407 C5-methylase (RsmB/RsmF family)/NOL1/NOP2/fmu family ribosome biogenesis protein